MTVASLAEVMARLIVYTKTCGISPIVVAKNSKAAAVPVSLADDKLESVLLTCSPRFREVPERPNRKIDQRKGIRQGDFWKRADGE